MQVCGCVSRVPRRHIICLLCFLGLMITYIMRFCISIAITEMVVPHRRNMTSEAGRLEYCPYDDDDAEHVTNKSVKGEFSWDERTQGLVLSSFFWGYVLTQVPGGLLAERLGGKYTLMVAVLLSALCTLATPWAARWGGAWGLVALRVVLGCGQGFVYPSLNALLAKWVAIEERGRLGAWVFTGANFGNVVSMSVSGLLLSRTGWETLFYVYGGAALLWVWAWAKCGYSGPEDHPGLAEEEKRYLQKYWAKVHMKKRLPPTPWRHILSSTPLWGLIIAQIGHDWGLFTIITDLPKYMKTVLHFSIHQTGFRSAAPYLAMVVVAVMAGALVDFLLVKRITSVTMSRKLFTTVASTGPAAGIVAATLAECDKQTVTWCLILGMGLMGFFYPSLKVNCLDLSPNYAGTVMALVNGIGALSGVVTPYLAGLLIPDNTMEQWRTVFLTVAAVLVLTNLVYVFTASGELQYWNDPPVSPSQDKSGLKFQSEKRKVVVVDDLTCPSAFGFRKTTREVVIPRVYEASEMEGKKT